MVQALGLSERQIKRQYRKVREHGSLGLISQRRGQPSNRRISQPRAITYFVGLVRQHYADFGPELEHEYLTQEHGFTYSTEILRNWMIQDGLWRAKPRKLTRIHNPRERSPLRATPFAGCACNCTRLNLTQRGHFYFGLTIANFCMCTRSMQN